MLTKFYLHYGDTEYELKEDDLYNWDEIQCSYKRDSLDGVVRSFTSQFVFVNKAKEILFRLFLQDGINARASVSVQTITDLWRWEERFKCPLDFSTVTWERGNFKINAVDNNLEAVIKANKGTKYELLAGKDLACQSKFRFDRIPVMESITYGFTQGEQFSDCADILVTFSTGRPWVGNKGKEVFVNGSIDWRDDQEDNSTGYILEAAKDIDLTLEYDYKWRTDEGNGSVSLFLCIEREGNIISKIPLQHIATAHLNIIESISSVDFLPSPDSINPAEWEFTYAIIGNRVWHLQYEGKYIWKDTGKSREECFTASTSGQCPLQLHKKDKIYISSQSSIPTTIRIIESNFRFRWFAKGESIFVSSFKPKTVATALLKKMSGDEVKADIYISDHDPRLAMTYLMSAESIRGIDSPRFYSSFAEFSDWMQSVFGYVYYIGKPQKSRFKYIRKAGQIHGTAWKFLDEPFRGRAVEAKIGYVPAHAMFLYFDNESGNIYSDWQGSDNYNDPETGHPRTDTLFILSSWSESDYYWFEEYVSGSLQPILYDHSEDYVGDDGFTVYFVHRSELFPSDLNTKKIKNCRDIIYNVDSSLVYSAVTAGYDKKDYDGINGIDEFNFNNTYSTGCTRSDKALSLISKYRADSFGIEYLAQKRGAATTDNAADKDVFFVLCEKSGDLLVPDKSSSIEGTITGQLFNGAFSPMACIRANAGFIGLQAVDMTLKFASSTGNSDIVIDGEPMSADITLNTPLATAGWIEFLTDEVDDIANVDELVEVVDEEGTLYRGYLKEVDLKFAKTEAAKYKLIIKDIVP